jgi:C4-dicarboxylate-specific signal transduction histidine kinase
MATRSGSARGSKSRAALVTAVAHEVGNLLAAVRLSAHLLPHAPEARERARGARQIEQLAAQAGEILAQLRPLLATGRRGAGTIPVAEVLEGMRRALADEPGVERLQLKALPRGLPDLRADADALLRVLLTLARGALDASPEGAVTLRVRRTGRVLVFELADSGRDFGTTPRGAVPGGRALAVRLADAVLRGDGGRVDARSGRSGTRVRVAVRAAARAGSGARFGGRSSGGP